MRAELYGPYAFVLLDGARKEDGGSGVVVPHPSCPFCSGASCGRLEAVGGPIRDTRPYVCRLGVRMLPIPGC